MHENLQLSMKLNYLLIETLTITGMVYVGLMLYEKLSSLGREVNSNFWNPHFPPLEKLFLCGLQAKNILVLLTVDSYLKDPYIW